MMVIHQQHLQRQNDEILKMLRLHEKELVLLWVLGCGIMLSHLYQTHLLKAVKERNDRATD
jgi:hypothetical protein